MNEEYKIKMLLRNLNQSLDSENKTTVDTIDTLSGE